MSQDCEVCQRHAQAYEDAGSNTERRMLLFLWHHHDAMAGHRVFRYEFEDEGLTCIQW